MKYYLMRENEEPVEFSGEPIEELGFDYSNKEPLGHPEIKFEGGELSFSIEVDRKSKKIWGRIFQMPQYKITEWRFPKKKKRGSKRRARRMRYGGTK